jgi:Ca-activated chloride channel family protein
MASEPAAEDVLVLLDCSRSMLATDIRPNRLERAKLAILDFLKGHANSRVGLIVFAGQAFLQCPLTFDHAAFRETLAAVDEKTIPVSGTDLGRALDEAFLASENPKGRQLMLMFTDGEDLQESGVEMAEKLAENNVMVLAVGVGTPAGSEIPILTDKGMPDVIRDEMGRPVRTRLQEETLIKIAQATHGSYRPLGVLGEGLGSIKTDLEARRVEEAGRVKTQGVDRFQVPLAFATILLVTESLMGTRRRGQPSRFEKEDSNA